MTFAPIMGVWMPLAEYALRVETRELLDADGYAHPVVNCKEVEGEYLFPSRWWTHRPPIGTTHVVWYDYR